jgi:hypothetical protein
MITKNKSTRFVFALLLSLSAIGLSTSVALADKPTKTEFTLNGSGELAGVCNFTISIESIVTITATDFFNLNGVWTRSSWHIVEQDTFKANGKTLVGIPFTYNAQWLVDSSGNMTLAYAIGITEKVPLPDGSLFISAGRIDYASHPGAPFMLSPDKGNPGNVAGFCAALAP